MSTTSAHDAHADDGDDDGSHGVSPMVYRQPGCRDQSSETEDEDHRAVQVQAGALLVVLSPQRCRQGVEDPLHERAYLRYAGLILVSPEDVAKASGEDAVSVRIVTDAAP